MTVADDQLARIGSVLDGWDREDAALASDFDERLPDCAREALALSEAIQPIIAITLKLGTRQGEPGHDLWPNSPWPSVPADKRVVASRHEAAINPVRSSVSDRPCR